MRLSFLLHVSLYVCAAAICQGSTILSENFDELTAQPDATSVGAFHTVGGTDVDILGPSYMVFPGACAAPESSNCVDMDGGGLSNPQYGILQSGNITLSPGMRYFLSFDLIGAHRNNLTTSTTVTFGSYSQTFVLASGDNVNGIVYNASIMVPNKTVTTLTFTSNTPGYAGAMLDNVLVTSSLPAPEISSGGMMAFALPIIAAGIWGSRSRRRMRSRLVCSE